MSTPTTARGTAVLWGPLAAQPFGGMTWQVLHHLQGLRDLGHDVWYVEDSDRMPLDPSTLDPTVDVEPNLKYLARQLDLFGFGDRWLYRIPGRVPLELALQHVSDEEVADLRQHGWRVLRADQLMAPASYGRYISESLGEFTVAKDQNVRFRSGWLSDRSACYLAAGAPVVMQDTAFDRVLPTGKGLFAFQDVEGAVAAIEQVADDPALMGPPPSRLPMSTSTPGVFSKTSSKPSG